jgi:hypothetical protein
MLFYFLFYGLWECMKINLWRGFELIKKIYSKYSLSLGNQILMFQERNVARVFYKYTSFNEGPKSFDLFRICKGK